MMQHPTLDELMRAVEQMPAPPVPRLNGQVKCTRYLPYTRENLQTGEPETIHAVVVKGVLFVSPRAFEALKQHTGKSGQ
jgi:hypothetical protein